MHKKHFAENIVSTVYIESKIDNKKYCKTNGQFTRHLRSNKITYKEYFEKYVTGHTPLCKCGSPLSFYQKTESYANSCGNPICVGNNVSATKQSWTADQKKADSANKRAAAKLKTPEQLGEQYRKTKETFKERYGVEWGSNLPSQKAKSQKTKLTKYGNERFNNSVQASKTRISMPTDKKNAMNERRRQTNIAKYGVGCVMILPDAKTKSAISNSIGREFVLPSGTVVGVRGYEDIVLTNLLERYAEEDLLFHNTRDKVYTLPIFEYIDTRRHHMKYYPDIFIPKENKIIEVKSRWWWDGNGDEKYKSRLENNLRKRRAVLDRGFTHEVWLFEDKKTYKILNDSDF